MENLNIGIIGNPNCGKTTLFNALTGAKQRVGNWPGVTVDRKTGSYHFAGERVEVIDTPGIYSLSAGSLDEQVTRNFILSGEADLVVNIVDASNLERNLYLTCQLLEMKIPLIIALNMMDMATEKKMDINVQEMSRQLGCPVVPLTATKGDGLDALKDVVAVAAKTKTLPSAAIEYPGVVDESAKTLAKDISDACLMRRVNPQWLAVKLLENDELAVGYLPLGEPLQRKIQALQQKIEQKMAEEVDIVIASARYEFASGLFRRLVKIRGQAGISTTERIDRLVLNRIAGIPIFLVAMYLMFMFTINLGGAFIDFFDQLAGAVFVDGMTSLLAGLQTPEWLVVLLAQGIGGGIQTMATFIPPIGFMFLFLSFLEDSGYMARAAFVMDRFMRFIGLPGKAFIPMIVGFGCNVPAIMATRTLENERDRILTSMMTPFMSCGARLPVYALFAVAFFPTGGQNLVFALYLIGIAFAVFTGLVLKKSLLQGEVSPFVMEMPPYHLPSLKSVGLRAYDRLQAFILRASKVLMPIIMVLSILNSLGTDGSFNNQNSEKSMLTVVSKTITPVLKPFGVTEENWPATVGIFTGIFAKEAVVGTLDALYKGIEVQEEAAAPEEKEPFNLLKAIQAAFATIPENLGKLSGQLTDPLGISLGDVSDKAASAEQYEVKEETFGAMVKLFGSQSAAFAYLLFVLLYFPCVAALAAVYRETGLFWTFFAGAWTTFLAYISATFFYQTVNFSVDPGYSATILLCDCIALIAVIALMKIYGVRQNSARKDVLFSAAPFGRDSSGKRIGG